MIKNLNALLMKHVPRLNKTYDEYEEVKNIHQEYSLFSKPHFFFSFYYVGAIASLVPNHFVE